MRTWAVALTVVVAAFGASACSGSEENEPQRGSSPTPGSTVATPATVSVATPTSTPTADPSVCPVDAATCAFAERILMAVATRDVSALEAIGSPGTVKCPVPRSQGLGGPYPLCEDATVDGEEREGYLWSSGSHGGLQGQAGFLRDLEGLVNSGLPLATVGCRGESNSCVGDFVLAFGPNSLGDGDLKVMLLVVVRRGDPAGPDGIAGVLPSFVPSCNATDPRCGPVVGGRVRPPNYRNWLSPSDEPNTLPGAYHPWHVSFTQADTND